MSTPDFQHPKIIVGPENAGIRLDQFVAELLTGFSRSQIASAIRDGAVTIHGSIRKNSYRLKPGDELCFLPFEKPVNDIIEAEPVDFTVLYEDEHLLFLDKPHGVVVHPGSGNRSGTLVNGLLHYCAEITSVGDSERPGIVHRLDKDTSGVMVVAKTTDVHRKLVELFKNHQLTKEYLAIACGNPEQECGRIVTNIGRHPVQRQKMAVLERGGRFAATNWLVKERFPRYCLMQLNIETGRTHQIRVHLGHLGFPVAGDQSYGGNRGRQDKEIFPRQMLHARRLSLTHPITGENCNIVAPIPFDMEDALNSLRREQVV